MQIFPNIQIKQFKECAAGELIRLQHRNTQLAFVGHNPKLQARYQVRLSDAKGNKIPTFFLMERDEELEADVISFGQEYFFDVDHEQQFEFGPQTLSQPGLLYLCEDQWFMQARAPSPEYSPGFLNLRTGHFGAGPDARVSARFGKWSLKLPTNDPLHSKLLMEFAIGSVEGG